MALASPENLRLSQEKLAQKMGISSRALRKHFASDPTIRADARELFRRHHVQGEMLEVDKAMLAAAKQPGKDGTPDRRLAYRVMDGIGERENIRDESEFEFVLTCAEDQDGIREQVGFRVRLRRGD